MYYFNRDTFNQQNTFLDREICSKMSLTTEAALSGHDKTSGNSHTMEAFSSSY